MISINNPGEGGGAGSGGVTGGSEDPSISGKNLREGSNITLRPKVLTSRHLYNLRNQSWSIPRASFDGGTALVDTISTFIGNSSGRFPSNADYTAPFIYANTSSSNDKFIERFQGLDCYSNPVGSTNAPIGYFVIDVLDRGSSRISAYAQMMDQYSANTYNIDTLPLDESPTGPTCVAEYSGRVFYSGFSGVVNDPDSSSPKLSSYVLFSQLVKDFSSIYACYQAADPTAKDNNDLVDTDGGFIRLDGAYNICAMAAIQTGLVVLAENGAWVISGGTGTGFSGTNYQVVKVTTSGCTSPNSVVVVDNTVFYWSTDGIYTLTTNQFGNFIADNITRKTIQTLYNGIGVDDQRTVIGTYDQFEQKIKWIYGNRQNSDSPTIELCLDTVLGAWSKNTFPRLNGTRNPWLVGGIQTNPFTLIQSYDNVVDLALDTVTDSAGDLVINPNTNSVSSFTNTREIQYLVITDTSSTIKFTFANYTDLSHTDWLSFDGTGMDATAFLLTGVLAGGDYQRNKGVTYITAHFTKTETGLIDDGTGSGDLTLANQSSCIFQSQWDWSNSINSNKWSTKQQIYRIRRPYYPDANNNFDNGFYVVETRSKVRGSGHVLSFLFQSEPKKHMELLGWSVVTGVAGNV